MRWMNLAKGMGAAAAAALLIVGCTGGGDEGETPATTAEEVAEAPAATAAEDVAEEAIAEEAEAEATYVGTWRQTDDPDPSILDLLEGGRVTTNEESLPEGRWEETPGGNVVIMFTGQQTVRITGEMNGEVLVLTLPDGETGRFERSTGGGSAPARGASPGDDRSPWD